MTESILYRLGAKTSPYRQTVAQRVMEAEDGAIARISPPSRNLDQNAAQWPILEAFSKQLLWPVNGVMTKLSAEEFKDILTAAFKKESVRLAQSFEGFGIVMLGFGTSKMSKKEFSEWLDFLKFAASKKGVILEYETTRKLCTNDVV